MTDQVLNILKFVLLGLLYLFFARVLWAVWSEVRAPVRGASGVQTGGKKNNQRVAVPAGAATSPLVRPEQAAPTRADTKRAKKAAKGKQGRAARLVILEPAERRGLTVGIAGEITLGRDPNCTIVVDDDAFVSQVHLRIFDYDGQPMVEDLGSTNGTYHNGVKLIGAKLLHQGDRLQVGTTLIEAQ
jgi:pSer/pThr/pTyr-binding forkhead associated (FHA) protein